MNRRFLPYGERAVLLELDSIDHVLGAYAAIQNDPPDGLEDVVPAALTLLMSFTDPEALAAALPALKEIDTTPRAAEHGELATIGVHYDGADLAEVAALTAMSIDEVISVHSGAEYTVAFHGFAPGFAYLIGLDDRLRVPRRPSPRTAVPAGSVAMTGGFTAVYPRRSPGGWQLVGHTDTPMWNEDRSSPALLSPGMRVRFEAL
ncbi:MAG: 5-oxoprolinase subunit B family protein [Cumulibacter sp.]